MQASRIGWGVLLAAIWACGDGAAGDPGTSPPPNVVTRTDPATTEQCPFGGSVVSSGLDSNASGTLDDTEIRSRTVICNPPPTTTPPVLVRLRPEPKGGHCEIDGTAVDSGPDTNGNGTLDDAEVAHTDYACGEALVTRFDAEPAGPHCVAGGLAFSIGLDRNRDGALNNDEVLQIEYECSDILSRNVIIQSDANLAALTNIRIINGFVAIVGTSLTDIALPQLMHVTGEIHVRDNPQLTRISLPALQSVDDAFTAINDPSLATVEAPALQRVKQLKVTQTALSDLGGFSSLQAADAGIVVLDNPALQDVALKNLSSIGGTFEVAGNPRLLTLSLAVQGPLDLVEVQGDSLQTLSLSLDSVRQRIAIGSNPRLTAATVAVAQWGGLVVSGNPVLGHLTIDPEQITGDVLVTGNDLLRSIDFVSGPVSIHGSLTLSGPFDDTLGQVMSGFDIDGDCTIQRSHLTRLSMFRVGGTLSLTDNAELTGPISAHSLGGLSLAGSPAMQVLTLDTPQLQLPGSVVVGGNDALREIDLGSITSIGQTLALVNSPALVTTPGSVTHIGAQLVLQNDPALVDLGFDALQHVGFLIDIEGMGSLHAIELPALTQVQNIEVFGNGALRHLGLAALVGPATIFVSGNPHLPACEVDALFARVPGTHEQQGNDETATCTGPP